MNQNQIKEAAVLLLDATRKGQERDRISSLYPDFSLSESYQVQREGMRLREKAGARWIGWKMGLTSEAKRKQMNLDSPIFGYLHDVGQMNANALSLKGLIHPKLEPEIGFRMKKELKGKVSFEEAFSAIQSVAAACEVIDSRYIGFKYFSLPDVVADNCSASHYVWGEEITDFKNIALDKVKMSFYCQGQLAHEALAGEISGHPVHSIMQLAELLAQENLSIPAGALVLAGAATPAVAMEPGQSFELKIESFPTLTMTVGTH